MAYTSSLYSLFSTETENFSDTKGVLSWIWQKNNKTFYEKFQVTRKKICSPSKFYRFGLTVGKVLAKKCVFEPLFRFFSVVVISNHPDLVPDCLQLPFFNKNLIGFRWNYCCQTLVKLPQAFLGPAHRIHDGFSLNTITIWDENRLFRGRIELFELWIGYLDRK